MSSVVLLRVTCDRCARSETLEPVKAALKHAKAVNQNASAEGLQLHELRERPAGWGRVELRCEGQHGVLARELCDECIERVRDAMGGAQ